MNNNITEIVFILDRSGSMAGMEADTVGGFNATVERQKAGEGRAFVSTVLFNSQCEVLHDRVEIGEVSPMSVQDFRVGGCTALYDAIGGAIHHIGNIHKYARPEDVPAHTLFVIMTDGMENASHRYSLRTVREQIERQQEKYGWEFLFLAANIDAGESAERIGIHRKRAVNYQQDPDGICASYGALCDAIEAVREGADLDKVDWCRKIRTDNKRRRGK